MRQCESPECSEAHYARGFCKRHYKAKRNSGALPKKDVLLIHDRLKKYSRLNPETGCVEWTGRKNPAGYGIMRANGKARLSHRVAYELANGKSAGELCVLHHCDNRSCINPNHLFIGTRVDNAADRDAKGRQAFQKGERHGRAKLTNSAIKAIRADTRAQKEIAADYGVRQPLISRIQRGVQWAHVT